MNTPRCLVCNTESNFLMKKDGFDEYLCPECGLSFIYPQPTAEWLKDTVYSFESGYQGNKKRDLSLTKEDTRTRKIFEFLTKEKPGGKLLDVGCSSGQFLYFARSHGIPGVGLEINKRTADIARENGFEVFSGFLEDAPYEKSSFDIVYLGDVIEHVNVPRDLIKQCKELLREDGVLVISTPNMECFWSSFTLWLYKLFGIPWAPATPPHHLSQFGFSNLNRLLGDHGFSLAHSIFTPPSSLKYELGSLHLYGGYKRHKSLGNLCLMLFGFAAYTLTYYVNLILHPFLAKDFQMVTIYSIRV